MAATRAAKDSQVAKLRNSTKAQLQVMTDTISTVWINLLCSMGRVQGYGKLQGPLGGSRQIFPDARKSGNINRDVYVASALIEYHCYKHPTAMKVFEARAVFEAIVGTVTAEKARKYTNCFASTKLIMGSFAKFTSSRNARANSILSVYSDISRFSSRSAYKAVDRCSPICVVSTAQQCKPKSHAISPPDIDHITRDGRDYLNHPMSPTNGTANGSTVSQKRPPNEDLGDSSEYQKLTKCH
ncbi:hypothetical protein HOY82DRAFT_597379 [Tuber indicum]|nr:hypothetical protein HOY82DRAFT_597379 [Tuber indicum]